MFGTRPAMKIALGAILLATSVASAQRTAPTMHTTHTETARAKELPLKHVGKPTTAEITAADLMTRLYIFADDSMMGREVGTVYNDMGTSYIEREVRRLGLVPAGDSGTYFQNLPVFTNLTDSASSMMVGDERLVLGTDFLLNHTGERRVSLAGVPVIYGGTTADSTTWPSSDAIAGKVVAISVPATSSPTRFSGLANPRFADATLVLIISLDRLQPGLRAVIGGRRTALRPSEMPRIPLAAFISSRTAGLMFGPMDSAKTGMAGRGLSGTLITRQLRAPGRNVVAILPGTDSKLKGQYVAIGAHNDHVGFTNRPVDHDSLRAFNMIAQVQGADSPAPGKLTEEQSTRLRRMIDSLRALRPARLDSIHNGADDDGSGSMSVLEIAQAFAGTRVKPRRSLLFIWHAGEEKGLWGSLLYTDKPTVSRDSIVAQLNLDMVGRGAATDVTGETKGGELTTGGKGYVQLVGSRRLSTELGDLIESVNSRRRLGLTFDYAMDANGHPQNIYCRSDHYAYARYGIPVVFFTTGGHADYHQVTDEPQYIDYARLAAVSSLVYESALALANLDHRVKVDKEVPNPRANCVQ